MGEGRIADTAYGRVEFSPGPNWPAIGAEAQIRAVGTEQSNVSVIVDERIMLKIYRRIRSGVQPELEVTRFLTETAAFPNTPEFLGAVEEVSNDGEHTALAIAFAFIPNQGDAWNAIVEALDRRLEDLALVTEENEEAGQAGEELYVFPLDLPRRLGERTGELHRAFATPTSDPAFASAPLTSGDIARWAETVRGEAEQGLNELVQLRNSLSGETERLVSRLLDAGEAARARIASIANCQPIGLKTRIHGDYHLGQVLIAQDDVIIVDFESRAGEVPERILTAAAAWRDRASREFLQAYFAIVPELAWHSGGNGAGLLDLFLLQKAFYEIVYESSNRPSWLHIPVRGVLDLVEGKGNTRP
jgi:maltose alpha-D-glucosyltransferase/alpha-amylase